MSGEWCHVVRCVTCGMTVDGNGYGWLAVSRVAWRWRVTIMGDERCHV